MKFLIKLFKPFWVNIPGLILSYISIQVGISVVLTAFGIGYLILALASIVVLVLSLVGLLENLEESSKNAYAVYINWNGYQRLKEQDVKNFSKLPDVG